MKNNVHVLSTDKPSRLYFYKSNLFLTTESHLHSPSMEYQNIYITSDEEIKEGDWHLSFLRDKLEVINYLPNGGYRKECLGKEVCKIILTTDQDLIKDGVQAIDDDFLEWFVNNPSCIKVEVVYGLFNPMGRQVDPNDLGQNHSKCVWKYKIIIPKEKPKYPIGGYAPGNYSCNCTTCKKQFQGDKRAVQCEPCAIEMIKKEPKQETLEETAERLNYYVLNGKTPFKSGFKEGAKWMQERSYSEEEVLELLNYYHKAAFAYTGASSASPKEWFKQFKKK